MAREDIVLLALAFAKVNGHPDAISYAEAVADAFESKEPVQLEPQAEPEPEIVPGA